MDCYLGTKQQIQTLIKKIPRFIYLDKGYHKSVSENIYSEIRKNGGLIVSLDEEGAVDYPDGSTLMSRYSKSLFDNADLVFMWGKAQYDLVAKNMLDTEKVMITGHPRFEMLKNEFHYLYEDKVQEIKKKYGNFILFNTNMGFGNNIRGTEFVEQNYGDRFTDIRKNIAFDKHKLEAYINLIQKFSDKLSSNIVIRPHPEEDRFFYEKHFGNNSKIHVVYDGSVIPWLLATDLLIHPDCTTGIESLFLGRKSISFLPAGYPKELATHLPLKASYEFTDIGELMNFVESSSKRKSEHLISRHSFAKDFFSVDIPSTAKIAERISELETDQKNIQSNQISLLDKLNLSIRLARSKITKNQKAARLLRNKMSGFTAEEVKNFNLLISANFKVKCELESINSQLFRFHKKEPK
jgi:surface carbohydrate biosynthesis protein